MHMLVRAAALLAACSVSMPALAQDQQTSSVDRGAILAAAGELMNAARYCTLATLGPTGHPQARIVDPFAPEADMTVWIATKPVTRKVAEIAADPRVTLLYFDPAGPGYVTLIGRAVIVSDAAEKHQRWKQDWADFYEDRNRGEDYVLIRVDPIRLEILSLGHGLLNDPQTWRPLSIDLNQP